MTIEQMIKLLGLLLVICIVPSLGGDAFLQKNIPCIDVPSTLCIKSDGAEKVYATDAASKGLIGRWTFDDVMSYDSSGHHNHIKRVHSFGPGVLGRGSSAYFNGSSFAVIPHQTLYDTKDFTISLWVFLHEDVIGSFKPIITKEIRQNGRIIGRFPSISLWPESRRLHVKLSLAGKGAQTLSSVAAVPLNKWTHIAVTLDGRVLQIYVNGAPDSEAVLRRAPRAPRTHLPYFVAGNPWTIGLECYIDNLEMYNKPLSAQQIMAVGSVARPDLHSSASMSLACVGCGFNDAVRTCKSRSSHVCTRLELAAGGFTMARIMGWFDVRSEYVWNWLKDGVKEPQTKLGSGVCCSDL